MSKLPRPEELPRSEDGYDAERVEEAFSSFAERVRELESVAGELRTELRSLRAERAGARRAISPFDEEEWPNEPGVEDAGLGPSPDWVASVPAPVVRPLAIPRIAFEGIFLLLVALFAGLADLSATWIVIVMAAAWALVAISEWAASAKRARWRLEEIPNPLGALAAPVSESTGPWSIPVVEATAVDLPDVSESHTVIAQLPVDAELDDADADAEAEASDTAPRRRKAEPAPDPWEA